MSRWTLAVLLGAALGGVPAAQATVSFQRADIGLPGAPDSVAIGDLDGRDGQDIAIALPALGSVGVLLSRGDGTFAPMTAYTAGPSCAGLAVDITLGDVTQPAPGNRLVPDGKLDAYVACTPNVVRLTGDGTGALTNPEPFDVNLPPYLGNQTQDLLALVRRADGNPVPLLAFTHAVGSFGRQLCLAYAPADPDLVCNPTTVIGPLAVGDLNGASAGVPPDEIVAGEVGDALGIFGFSPPPLMFSDSTRTVPDGIESAAIGDLDDDGDLDVLTGQFVNDLSDRVASIHSLTWGPTGLDQIPRPLPSIAGLDDVAIADVDGDGCNDVVGAGEWGRGIVHLADGAGGFDGGRDLAQLGYQVPGKSTRVTLAVGDLAGDGLPELVVADASAHAVMVFSNRSTPAGGACFVAPPPPPLPVEEVVPVVTNTGAGVVPPAAVPTPPPVVPRTCDSPGTTAFTVGTPGADVLVGTAGRDVLSGRGGNDCLFGLANDDRMSGGSGNDVLVGSSGGDRMNGDAGDDKLNAGNGNDTLTPGAGKDIANGQGGNDEIYAADRNKDTIDCGAGRDKVTADRNDAVRNCEFVKRR